MKIIANLVSAFILFAPFAKADDFGNTRATASPVTQTDTPGILESTTDEDWFKIVVPVPGLHWIYTTGPTDTSGQLYDQVGNYISSTWLDDNAGNSYNMHMEGILSTGTYYLKIKGGSTIANTGGYTLSVRSPANALPFDGPNLNAGLTTGGQTDLYRFTITKPGYVWLFSTGNTDTDCYLYDHSGQYISSAWVDDNAGYSYNFHCEGKLQAGTYYLRVRAGASGTIVGNYTLSIRSPENALRFDTANRESSLAIPGDLDLYRIRIASAGPVWIYSTGLTDTDAYLYDEAGNYISSSFADDNDGSAYNFLMSGALPTGSYYLRIKAGVSGAATGHYGLHVRQAATATPLFASGGTSHSIGVEGDLDLFTFTTTGGIVSFSTSGTTATWGGLFGTGGNQIWSDSGENFSLSRTVTAGTYYLLARGASLDLTTGSYQLIATFPAGASPVSLSAPASLVAGTGSSTVNVTTSGAWSVSGLPSWATASQASGVGNATLTFTLAPNLSGFAREASVTIGGISYLITQNPAGDTGGTLPEPALTIFPAVILAIHTVSGANYRIETSADLVQWADTGVSFTGNGLEMSCAIERNQAKAYFRAAVE